VDITTINSTNVAITTSGNPIPGGWSYNYSGNDVIGANFSPVNPLPPSTPISVSASGLLDYAGNTFPAASSNFTTAATPDYSTSNCGARLQLLAVRDRHQCFLQLPLLGSDGSEQRQ
jgi:hypothetical protein